MATEMTRKRRQVPFALGTRRHYAALRQNGAIVGVLTDSNIPANLKLNQITDSEGHRWPFHRRVGELRPWDVGGPFHTSNQYLSDQKGRPIEGVLQDGWLIRDGGKGPALGQYEFYRGPVLPVDPTAGGYFPSVSSSSDAELDAVGAKAVSIVKPTNPVVDMSTFLGELFREGLPDLVGLNTFRDRTFRAKTAGGEYLNVQFGWAPMIRDLRKLHHAIQTREKTIQQFERNSGRDVRRRFHFPTMTVSSGTVLSNNWAAFGPNSSAWTKSTGVLTRHRVETTKQWFSGSFTYYLPPGNDNRAKMVRSAAELQKLYGASLTPNTVWNLTPWSWALDWFTNAGAVISNLSDKWTMGLIMRYGYVMETKVTTDTYVLEGLRKRVAGVSLSPLYDTRLSFTTIVKHRRPANPFGFGVTWDGLSPFQLSILAALGLTRGRR